MHTLAYSLDYEFPFSRVNETAHRGYYQEKAEFSSLTEVELERICAVLKRLSVMRVDNPEDAEDLVQETLLTMIRKAPEIDLEKGVLIWAMGILRKKVGNYYRRAQRFTSLDDQKTSARDVGRCSSTLPSPESSLRHAELCTVIDGILLKLSPCERTAIDLYLAGRQTCEIVSLLYPERYQNIVNRLHRGRRKLAKELARHGYARRWREHS